MYKLNSRSVVILLDKVSSKTNTRKYEWCDQFEMLPLLEFFGDNN